MKPTTMFALEALELSVSYKTVRVLDGLNVQVRHGEIYALLGGNGAGKSTTLAAFLGFTGVDRGTVRVCGVDVRCDPLAARGQLAYVPENAALYGHLSARENIAYLLGLAGAAASPAAIDDALSQVSLERSAWDQRLDAYSKGMRQKVAIALALARSVPVLLLDEPTSGLDPQATSDFNALLRRLRERQVAVLMVTHDLLGAAEVADRIGFLDQGAIAEEFHARGAERFDVRQLFRRYACALRVA